MKKIIVTILVLIVLCLAVVFDTFLIGWFQSISWHLRNDNKVVVGNISISLPYNWWVIKSKTISKEVVRTPNIRGDFFQISLKNGELSSEKMRATKTEVRLSNGTILHSQGVEEFNIGNRVFRERLYQPAQSSSSEDRGYYWLLSIPGVDLHLVASKMTNYKRDIVVTELLPEIINSK